MTKRRKVIVHIAASADGYIARPEGDLEWLTSRPAPEGFYGMNDFMKSIDTLLLGRKTYQEFTSAFGGQSGGDRNGKRFDNLVAREMRAVDHDRIRRARKSSSAS